MFCQNGTFKFTLALVTGSTSGIGLALCRLLANEGINLILHGRDEAKLLTVADELRDKVEVQMVIADLAIPEEQKKVAELIALKQPDLLINNAGFGFYGPALDYSTDEQLSILSVDGEAAVRLSLEAARTLIARGRQGVVMNISSAAAFSIFPNFTVYSATKALINQFSESFDEETRPQGVRILVACPGVVTTNFRSRAGGKKSASRDSIKPMSAEYAANEIWQQILHGQKIHIFNWKYRLGLFFVRFLLPKSIVARILKHNVDRLRSP